MRRQLLATPSPYQAAECQRSLQFWTVLCPWQPQEPLALLKEQQKAERETAAASLLGDVTSTSAISATP